MEKEGASAAPHAAQYEAAKARLLERVRTAPREHTDSLDRHRKSAEVAADRAAAIERMVSELWQLDFVNGLAEDEHDKEPDTGVQHPPLGPPVRIGPNGRPLPALETLAKEEDGAWADFDRQTTPKQAGAGGHPPVVQLSTEERERFSLPSFDSTLYSMRALAASYRSVHDRLLRDAPDARTNAAHRLAVLGLLHIWHWFGKPKPTLYNRGPFVLELAALCEEARVGRSKNAHRAALADGLAAFDPHWYPPVISEVLGLRGRHER